MAIPYPIPPWNQFDPGQMLQAAAQGEQLKSERSRLQNQQVLAQMTIQARQAEADREHELNKQKLEIEKAYREAEAGLKQDELRRREEETQLKVQEAAQQYQAQQMAQQEADQMIQAGEEPEKAWRLAWMRHMPQLSAGGQSGVMRGGGGGVSDYGPPKPVVGLPPEWGPAFEWQTGDRSRQLIRDPRTVQQDQPPGPAPAGHFWNGKSWQRKGEDIEDTRAYEAAKKRLDAAGKALTTFKTDKWYVRFAEEINSSKDQPDTEAGALIRGMRTQLKELHTELEAASNELKALTPKGTPAKKMRYEYDPMNPGVLK